MNYKSYLLEKNIDIINNKLALFYGENIGLINEFKKKIRAKNEKIFIKSFDQEELISRKNEIIQDLLNKSLFDEEKIYFINNTNDKIFELIKEIEPITKNQKIYFFSEILDKKSKIRKYFEDSKEHIVVPCYKDNEVTIKNIIRNELKEFNGVTPEIINIICNNCNLDRITLINELDKISSCFTEKAIDKTKLELILNIKSNDDFDNLKNEALNGNRTKTNNLINETVLESNKNIFYLNAINQRLAKLLEIIQKTRNSNYEDTINLMKPPIFWKEKPKFIEQLKNWNIIKIKRALNLSYDTEIKLKSNSLIDHDLLIKKLIIDVCIIANS